MKNDPDRSSGKNSAVSVVVPTYQRGAVLLQTLCDLEDLPVRPDEIVAVDQTPEYDPEIEEALAQRHRNGIIRRIRPDKPSITAAMNRGLREAEGDIVLFLDDDIIPDANLIRAHLETYEKFPEAWAVVGQVIQPEDRRAERREQRAEGRGHQPPAASDLRRDLDFKFNGTVPAWVENVIACNLSVKRERALALGGFDENFIPPVSYRFETEFAKRLIAAGGKIRFEPSASIRHLRAPAGGTRSLGSHLTSGSPLHGVGDYYYALCCGKGRERMAYMLRRPFREVCTQFHLRHPWWIPVKFYGELRAMILAVRLFSRRRTDRSGTMGVEIVKQNGTGIKKM